MFQTETVTATGDAFDLGTATAIGALGGACLLGAATATIREGGAGGEIKAMLGASATIPDHFSPSQPIAFKGKLHVTLSAAATLVLYKA